MKDYDTAYQLLLQLYDIIKIEGRGWVDSYIREAARIIALLEELNQDDEIELKEVNESIKGLYTGRASLSEFYIWRENEEERIRLNQPLSSIKEQLWKMFS